jgi:hypothetical protein
MDGMGTGGYDCITIPGIYFWHSHNLPKGITILDDIFIYLGTIVICKTA